jgi:hypothetical protein
VSVYHVEVDLCVCQRVDDEWVPLWGRGEAYMLDDLVGGRAVVLEDVVLGGAGGLDELLDDGLQRVSEAAE